MLRVSFPIGSSGNLTVVKDDEVEDGGVVGAKE